MKEGLQNAFGRRGRAAAALVLTFGALFGFRLDLAEAAGRWVHALTCCCPHPSPEPSPEVAAHPCEGHAADSEAEPEPAVDAPEGCGCAAPVLFADSPRHDPAFAPSFGPVLSPSPSSRPVTAAPWTAALPAPPSLPPDWRPPPFPDLLSSIVILS
ncbi:MAG: hypothetical protein AAFU79_13540 [Myxococcota bacterium]